MTESLNQVYDAIIIGGGPAGTTAAIYAARASLKVGILDKGLTTGALGTTSKIANYPGLEGEVDGAELLQTMRKQAAGFGAEFINDKAIGTDLNTEPKTVFGNLGVYNTRAIIIATGSMGRSNLIKGEAELLGRGVSYCAVCDAAFFKGKDVAVIGKSDEAVDEALYLTRFASTVHFFVPGKEINVSQEEMAMLKESENLVLHLGSVVKEIFGEGKVEGLKFVERGNADSEQSLPVVGVFVYLQGGKPITDFLQGQLPTSEEGCLQVDREFQTSIAGVYAIGDVICTHVKQAVIAAGDGAVAAIAAEKWLRGRSRTRVDWGK
ncbi:MAG TPA: FAD-dependent oxidoreductase [Anaerolineaceae bacterium]|jgi:thioredoxin reductase (NADPH)|nr:FAD-dependent oxidoreductase [Anaerolineaceae bacterium]